MYYNYLLFVPSLLSERSSEIRYIVSIDGISSEEYPEYTGLQTNEGVTKFLVDYLQNHGESLNKIIMFCTEQVKETKVAKIDNKTTLEYYKSSVADFLCGKNVSRNEVEDFFCDITYIPQNNENENQIIAKLEEYIKPDEKAKYKKRVFVDFTGGNRSSALTLVFACRILELSNVEIAKIFYSNLKYLDGKSVGVIEECTSTYKIFSALEEELKIKNDNVGLQNSDIHNKLEKQIHSLREDVLTAVKMNQFNTAQESIEKIEELLKSIDRSMMPRTKLRALKAIEQRCKAMLEEMQDPLLAIKRHMDKLNYDKAFSIFREKIIEVLYREKIIEVKPYYLNNGNIKNDIVLSEISAVYGYYESNKGGRTFWNAVKEYIALLNEHLDSQPKQIAEDFYGKTYYSLETYLKSVPKNGFKHSGYTRYRCDSIVMPYVKKYWRTSSNVEKFMKRYTELDFLYMGYGYPFACTFGNQYYFEGYDKLYKDNFENGVKQIQNVFEGKECKLLVRIREKLDKDTVSYAEVCRLLLSKDVQDILREVFPFQFIEEDIKFNGLKPEELNEFIYEFAKAFCMIRQVRNKITHPKDMENVEVKAAINMLEIMIQRIEAIKERMSNMQDN